MHFQRNKNYSPPKVVKTWWNKKSGLLIIIIVTEGVLTSLRKLGQFIIAAFECISPLPKYSKAAQHLIKCCTGKMCLGHVLCYK